MVVKTNAVDALPSKQVGQLAAPTSVRFLKKIIARIDTKSAHYQSALNEVVSRRRRHEPRFYQAGQRSASDQGGALD